VSLRGRRADIALGAVRRSDSGEVAYELRLGSGLPPTWPPGERVPTVDAVEAASVAMAVLAASDGARPDDASTAAVADRVKWVDADRLRRATATTTAPLGVHHRREGGVFVGVAPVLGRLDPALVAALVAALRRRGSAEVRLTPWRGFLVGDLADGGPLHDLAAVGLIVDRDDPAAGVVACAGRAGCASGTEDTVADGHAVVARLRERRGERPPTVHLSGCDKRCASHAPHDVTLIGRPDGGYASFDADEELVTNRTTPIDALELG
jgi:sulfite reductase beta subunit-like hemoprotein